MPLRQANGSFPDFILIGAARSGTTTLYQYLCKHPRIFMSIDKEPEYFSRASVYSRGSQWYQGLFAKARTDQVVGEASTTYSMWPHTLDSARLMAKDIPNVKLIYIMRHPVERAYSHYKSYILQEKIAMTFEEALEKDSIYLDCSMYIRQIERYLLFFPPERFLFLFSSQLRSEPLTVLKGIEEFLGIEKIDLTSDGIITANAGDLDHHFRFKTGSKLRKIPSVGLLRHLIPKCARDGLYRTLIKNTFIGRRLESRLDVGLLYPETRKRLIELFERPNQELEKFLGVQLDSWRS